MKVKDLIKHLQGYDPEDYVFVKDYYDIEYGNQYKEITSACGEPSGYDAESDKVLYTIYLE